MYLKFTKKTSRVKIFSIPVLFIAVVVIIIISLIINPKTVRVKQTIAASYAFIQSTWDAGATAGSTHSYPDDGLHTSYSSKDANITSGGDLTVNVSLNNWAENTSGFNNYTAVGTDEVKLNIQPDSVTLLKADGAVCSLASECQSASCCNNSCGGVPLTYNSANNGHCSSDCVAIGGVTVTVPEGTICKYPGASYSGWSGAGNWRMVTGNYPSDYCGRLGGLYTPQVWSNAACGSFPTKGSTLLHGPYLDSSYSGAMCAANEWCDRTSSNRYSCFSISSSSACGTHVYRGLY